MKIGQVITSALREQRERDLLSLCYEEQSRRVQRTDAPCRDISCETS